MPPSEVPGRAVSEDAAASWSAAALCRFAIYAQKTVLTLLAPKPKRQPPSLRYGGPERAGEGWRTPKASPRRGASAGAVCGCAPVVCLSLMSAVVQRPVSGP